MAVDDAACALLGYSKAELIGLHGSELVPWERQAETAVSLDRMRHGDFSVRTGYLKCKGGSVLSVDVSARSSPGDRLTLSVRKCLAAVRDAE